MLIWDTPRQECTLCQNLRSHYQVAYRYLPYLYSAKESDGSFYSTICETMTALKSSQRLAIQEYDPSLTGERSNRLRKLYNAAM